MKQVGPSEAVSRKYPEWIVLLVSRNDAGQPNVMPAGWAMICSGSPVLVAVAVAYTRYTYQCITQTEEFVFAWAGEDQADLVEQTGSTSGRDIAKFDEFSIPCKDGVQTNLPLLVQAAANLECELVHTYESGDHVIFVGEVVAGHVPDDPIRKLENFDGEFMVAQPVE